MRSTSPASPKPRRSLMRRLVVYALAAGAAMAALAATSLFVWARNDARLTAFVQQRLNDAMPHLTSVGRVHWLWPVGVVIEDFTVADQVGGPPALSVRSVRTRLALHNLLRGRVVVGPTQVDGADLWLDVTDNAATDSKKTDDDAQTPDRRTLADNLSRALTRVPKFTLLPVTITRSRVALRQDDMGASIGQVTLRLQAGTQGSQGAQMDASLALQDVTASSPAQQWFWPELLVTVQDLSLAAVVDGPGGGAGVHGHLGGLVVRGPGVDVTTTAELALHNDDSFDVTSDLRLGATLDEPLLQDLLDPVWRRALSVTGGLQSQVTTSAHGTLRASPIVDSIKVRLATGGSNLGVAHVPITGFTAQLAANVAQELHAEVFGQWDASSLALSLTAQGIEGGLGDHTLSLVLENGDPSFLLQRLEPLAAAMPSLKKGLTQAHKQLGLIPQAVSMRLQGDGAQLWPHPDTRWALEAQVSGMADPKVPKSAQPITVTLQATAAADGLQVGQMDVALGHSRVFVHTDAELGWSFDQPAHVRVLIGSHQLGQLLAEGHLPLSVQRLHLDLDLRGTPNDPVGTGALKIYDVRLLPQPQKTREGKKSIVVPLGDITVPLDFNGGTLMSRGATLAGQVVHMGLTGFVQLLGKQNKALKKHAMGFELRVHSADMEKLLGIDAHSRPRTSVRGLVLGAGSIEAPEISTDVQVRSPLGQGSAWATAQTDAINLHRLSLVANDGGEVRADGAWSPVTDQLSVHLDGHLPSPAGQPEVLLAGSVEGLLQRQMAVNVSVEAAQSHLLASGMVDTGQNKMDINMAAAGAVAQLAQWQTEWLAERPTGHINAQVRLRGALASPEATGTVVASGLGLGGRPVGGGRLHALLQTPKDGHYHVELRAPKTLEADVDVYTQERSGVRIEADIPHFSVAALYPPLGIQGADVVGDAVMAMRLGRRTLMPIGTLTIKHLTATSRGQTMALEVPTHLRVDGVNVGLARTLISGAPGRLAVEGYLGRVIRASASGQLALSFLTPFVPGLTYARGEMSIEAKAYGSRTEPQFEGQVQVTQPVVVRPRGVPIEVRLSRGLVVLTPNKLSVVDVRGGIEGGAFALGGDVALKDYLPTAYALHFDGHGIPVREGDLMLESNVALACAGPGDYPVVSGTVDIVSGRYLKALELRDFSFVGGQVDTRVPAAYQLPWLKNVGLDVHTVSHDGVDIAVDASAFAVKARVETDLHIGGNALEPKLTGKVQAREGVITFPHGDLQLSMAAVDFETARRTAKNPVGAEITLRASGEVTASGSSGLSGAQVHEVFMNLDGPPEALALNLSSDQGLDRLNVLSLLSTGHANIADLAGTGDEASKLDTAEALVGSLLTAPLSRFAQKKLEQVFNVNLDLSIKTSEGNVTVVAAKNINRRIRLEGAYSHGMSTSNTDQSGISTRAQMALTNRLRLEGNAAQTLTGSAQTATQGSMQSNVELKYRLMGH